MDQYRPGQRVIALEDIGAGVVPGTLGVIGTFSQLLPGLLDVTWDMGLYKLSRPVRPHAIRADVQGGRLSTADHVVFNPRDHLGEDAAIMWDRFWLAMFSQALKDKPINQIHLVAEVMDGRRVKVDITTTD